MNSLDPLTPRTTTIPIPLTVTEPTFTGLIAPILANSASSGEISVLPDQPMSRRDAIEAERDRRKRGRILGLTAGATGALAIAAATIAAVVVFAPAEATEPQKPAVAEEKIEPRTPRPTPTKVPTSIPSPTPAPTEDAVGAPPAEPEESTWEPAAPAAPTPAPVAPAPTPTPAPEPTPEPESTPEPEPTPSPTPEPEPEPEPDN